MVTLVVQFVLLLLPEITVSMNHSTVNMLLKNKRSDLGNVKILLNSHNLSKKCDFPEKSEFFKESQILIKATLILLKNNKGLRRVEVEGRGICRH